MRITAAPTAWITRCGTASGLSDTGTLTIAVKAVNDRSRTVSLADITQQGPTRRLAMRCKRRSTITIRTALRAA